jgi:peptide/nickel transport system substrate-binding protein
MSMSNLSRRSFVGLSGSAAAILGLGLVGCGGGNNSSDGAKVVSAEPQNGSPATTPLDQLPLPEKGKVYNNPLDRDQIQDGGTLTLPAGEIGPNWNYLSIEGNTSEMHNMWDWYMPTNLFVSDATASKFEPNPNFVTKAETKDDGGKQTLTLDINPDAKFNDGTPIDYRAFQAVWTVMNGTNPDYTPAATDGYDRIESVEKGDSDKQVVITTSNPVYPAEALFNLVIHPDAADSRQVFNSGWNNNPHADDWGYGPYTDGLLRHHAVSPLFPNPNWWGDAPKLESVTYKQMDSQALFNAFKNGEIDATGQTRRAALKEMLSNFLQHDRTPRSVARLSLSIANIEINSTRGVLTDENVRKAFVQCLVHPHAALRGVPGRELGGGRPRARC